MGRSLYLQKNSFNFDDKLNLYQNPKNNGEDKDYDMDEDLEEKNRREFKISQVALANIRQKLKENNINLSSLNQNIKNKEIEKNNNFMPIDIKKEDDITKEKEQINETIDNQITSKNSTYSRLTNGDFSSNLIKSSFNIHWGSVQIGNRINFFKTLINSKTKPDKILPDIKPKKESEENVKKIEGFNKEEYYNTINKENYENHLKTMQKKIIKNKAQKNLIKPVVEQILEITDYIYNYKNENNVKLVDDQIWKELTDKLISNELLNKSEDDIFIIKNEEKKADKSNEENDNNDDNENIESEMIISIINQNI